MMNAKNCCAFVRLVQSNNGWTKPYGLDYGHGNHFASVSGFGFEEWMNSDHPVLQTDTHRFIHIEAIRQGFNPAKHGYCRLILWMFVPQKRQKYIVGYIDNYQLTTPAEMVQLSQTILQNPQVFHDELNAIAPPINGFNAINIFDQQMQTNALGNEKIFNVKVRGNGMHLLDNFILLPKEFRHNKFNVYRNINETVLKFINDKKICVR
jgi:hypothetical protein